MLGVISQEVGRLQALWNKLSNSKGFAEKKSRQQLQSELRDIQERLVLLVSNLNDTQHDILLARQESLRKENLEELVTKMRYGEVNVNYETGLIAGANLSKISTTSEELHKLRQDADPAILHLDVGLLTDFLSLTFATAIGGKLMKSFIAE